MIEDDRLKLSLKENSFENRKMLLEKIEIHFEEVLNYIRQNTDKSDIITEKLKLIKNQLDDFNNNFNLFVKESGSFEETNRNLKMSHNSLISDTNNVQNFSFNKDNKEKSYNQGLSQDNNPNNINNKESQTETGFYQSQKLNKLSNTYGSKFEFSGYGTGFNPGLASSFTNFSNNYNKKSLHDELKL